MFGVGTAFPGGLSCFWVTQVGSGGFSVCSGMTMERRHMKGVLQSPALGHAGVPPAEGTAGVTEPGIWGQASLLCSTSPWPDGLCPPLAPKRMGHP